MNEIIIECKSTKGISKLLKEEKGLSLTPLVTSNDKDIYKLGYDNFFSLEKFMNICPDANVIDNKPTVKPIKDYFHSKIAYHFLFSPLILRYQKIFRYPTKEIIGAEFFCSPQEVSIYFSKYLTDDEKMLFDKRCFDLITIKTYEWRQKYKAFINIFPESWKFSGFCANVYLQVKKKKPKNLVIEILEEKIPEKAWDFFQCLKRRYVVDFVLDDFGSEAAFLTRLEKAKFIEYLKIDKQILWNKELFHLSYELIAKLAKTKKIIAEGIENEEMLNNLKGLNIYAVQGFYFHKPEIFEG
jgi:EAL domain-containing protein (putative c-di-GMP-specific phosphodiesterase class I)